MANQVQAKESGWEYKDVQPTILAQRPKALPKAPAIITPVSKPLLLKASGSNQKKKAKTSKSVNTWSPTEDETLLNKVNSMEPIRWKDVALVFKNRSDYACEKRYEKLMDPSKNLYR
jgi:hypothetical protein